MDYKCFIYLLQISRLEEKPYSGIYNSRGDQNKFEYKHVRSCMHLKRREELQKLIYLHGVFNIAIELVVNISLLL